MVRRDYGNNLAWVGLIEDELPPATTNDRGRVAGLAAALDRFFEDRQRRGISVVFHAYEEWLRRQEWHVTRSG